MYCLDPYISAKLKADEAAIRLCRTDKVTAEISAHADVVRLARQVCHCPICGIECLGEAGDICSDCWDSLKTIGRSR